MRNVGFDVVGGLFFVLFSVCFYIFITENIAGLSFMGVKQEDAPSPGLMQMTAVV